MKNVGIVLFIAGLLIVVITGFDFAKEKIVNIGKIEIARETDNDLTWPIGVAVMVLGGGVFLFGAKKL